MSLTPGFFRGHRQHQVREGPGPAPPHQGRRRGARGRHIHHEVTTAPAHSLALGLALAHATALHINLRFHVFIDSKEYCKVFLNIVPGTLNALPAEILHYNTIETFPVLSYPMTNMDGMKTKAELFPPADPAKKNYLHSLGLVNTLAIPVAKDDLAIMIDPRQLVRCIRNYRVNYILTNLNHTSTCMVDKLYLAFYHKRLLT